MRIKYYIRLFRQMSLKKSFVFSIIVLVSMLMFVIYLIKTITPTIQTLCENKARAIALQVTTQTVKEFLKDVEYGELMNLKYDEKGKISSLSADVTKMNKMSAEISYKIQEKLEKIDTVIINIPIGKLLGWSIFSGYGPNITIKVVPAGNVSATFKTEFTSEGINQTRHTIYIEITTSVLTVAPFVSQKVSFSNNMKVAETIIVGDIPDTYYNIEGLENMSKADIMQLIN